MKKKYGALRLIMLVYRLLAGLALLGGLLSGAALIMSEQVPAGIGSIVSGIIGFISLVAFAQLIQVFLDMEEHLRLSAEIQKRLYALQKERL
ncbi:MAG: hypothetical protein OHK0046_13050 [Anaerolineae bacterium]